MMKKTYLLLALLITLVLFTGCYYTKGTPIPQLEGYWRQWSLEMVDRSGFVYFTQEGQTVTQRSILNGTEVVDRKMTITDFGFEEISSKQYHSDILTPSGEIIPAGTYTTIVETIADLTDNEIRMYKQMVYLLVDGEKTLSQESAWYTRLIRSSKPQAIDDFLESFSPQLTVTEDYQNIFTAGEQYDVLIETIPDADLTNYSTEGTVTLTNGQKEIVLSLQMANWYETFYPTINLRYLFIQFKASNETLELYSRNSNSHNPEIIEGNAKINGVKIGTITF